LYLIFFLNLLSWFQAFGSFFFELIYKFVLNIISQQTGSLGFVYLTFIMSLFLFILISNLLSLVPFGIALTSHIIMIFFLSFTLSISIFLLGLFTRGLGFLKIFVPEAPFFLLFILIPIEIFSYFIRALSLAIRLSANIMAGHTLVFIISSFILILLGLNFFFFFFLYFCFLS
jgi:F-type H+-transporting ATPase subunit a